MKALIFDLGGVILDIDYSRCVAAFGALGILNFDEHYSQAQQSHLFDGLETGKLSPAEFRNWVRKYTPAATDHEVDAAWNAMILDFAPGRTALISALRRRYNCFLLSNTNAIHQQHFEEKFRREGHGASLRELFDKAYYSHEVGLRKPHAEVFRRVLSEQGLAPNEVVFIDDSPQHISGAAALGLHTIHLKKITDLEHELAPFLAQLD